MKYHLRDNKNKLKAIIFDRDVAETIKWLYVKDKWTMELEEPPKKVATVQPPLIEDTPHQGVESMRVFDPRLATSTPRKLAINVSYTVKHDVRNYLARHPTHGTIRGETFDHDTAAHWFYQKLRSIWPAYVISKS